MSEKSAGIFNIKKHHRAGIFGVHSSLILIACLILLCFSTPIIAEVTWTGDLDPSDPNTWDTGTTAYIGNTSNGTMDITNDSDILSGYGIIGRESGSTGNVTVDGPGSTWMNSNLFVGSSGGGVLNITNGGAVLSGFLSANLSGVLGADQGASGMVTVTGTGSTWINFSLLWIGGGGRHTKHRK